MVSFPPCKINLGLNIIEKRADGYHNIETCFYPIPWTDILEVIPSNNFSFTQSGIKISEDSVSNLCVKAYNMLNADFNLPPVQIYLHKILPMGAGLGGGSSDGAHTLRLLNQIFSLALTIDQLSNYASALGSDCAFFLQDKPMCGTAKGEVLSSAAVNLSGMFLLIVKPDIHVSTAEAYANITPHQMEESVRSIVENYSVEAWKGRLKNDFEESVFKKHPLIQEIKNNLYQSGAVYASMSGSGSAIFGIFNEPPPTQKFLMYTCWSGAL